MMRLIALLFTTFAVASLQAERITWFSTAGAVNQTSTGALMDGGFRFELGVFEGFFTPLPSNKDQWAQNWRPAMRTAYDPVAKAYNDLHEIWNNVAPFTVGKPAYVWGFRGDAQSGEWILFRGDAWTWPVVNPLNPQPPFWNAAAATQVIVGEVNGAGFLMKSAAVTNAAPPSTTWEQWQAEQLADEILDGPNDDPDHDGICNLLEFVFGSQPKAAGPPPQTPVSLVEIDGLKYLQITVPRRIDHAATLLVEVSGDLINWNSGASHTTVVSDGPAALVVRDKTALAPLVTKRFMRFRATVK